MQKLIIVNKIMFVMIIKNVLELKIIHYIIKTVIMFQICVDSYYVIKINVYHVENNL